MEQKLTEIPIFRFALTRTDLDYTPIQGTHKATGWDVKAALDSPLVLKPGDYAKIPIGFRVFAPEGWWLEIRPRSSSFVKKQLHCLYGVIDEDYEGDCLFACQFVPNTSEFNLIINPGDAIGQLIPVRRQEMKVEIVSNEEYDTLCKSRNYGRGQGGFGSTTK